ncbi:hypothetical protein CHUAL_012396 [Chamberlinius hualienensis]
MNIGIFVVILLTAISLSSSANNQIESLNSHMPRYRDHASYMVVASKYLRPGSVYALAVSLLKSADPSTVKASISRNGIEIISAEQSLQPGDTEMLKLKIPPTGVAGEYSLRVDGISNEVLGASFTQTTDLQLVERFLTIIIHTNRPVYNCYSTVLVRVLVFTLDMKPYGGSVTINFLIFKHRLFNCSLGVGTAKYIMAEYSAIGWWSVQVDAFGQTEEKTFLVEKFDPQKFEVFVWQPDSVLFSAGEFGGNLVSLFWTNAYIKGNCTIRFFADEVGRPFHNEPDNSVYLYEEILDPFPGHHEYSYRFDLLHPDPQFLIGKVIRMEVVVYDQLLGIRSDGYGSIYVIDSRPQLTFLGDKNKVYKPGMPFRVQLAVSHGNLVPMDEDRLSRAELTVVAHMIMSTGEKIEVEQKKVKINDVGVASVQMNTLPNSRYLILNAYYIDKEFEEATTEMIASAYSSANNRTISVQISSSPGEIGQYVIVHVRANFYIDSFNYMIMSKGLILLTGTEEMEILFQPIKTIAIPVSSEMIPYFRILVYHVAKDGVVISDSVSVPVKSINVEKLDLRVTYSKDKRGQNVEFGLSGKSGSVVGISTQDFDTFCHKCGADLTAGFVLENLLNFEEYLKTPKPFVKRMGMDHSPDTVLQYETSDYATNDYDIFDRAGLSLITDIDTTHRPIDRCDFWAGMAPCLPTAQCYPVEKSCDGARDCNNGFDEIGCGFQMDWQRLHEFRVYRKNRVGQMFDLTDGDWGWAQFNTDMIDYRSYPVPNRPSNWIVFAFLMDAVKGLSILEEPIYLPGSKPFLINVEMPTYCRLGEQIGIRIDAFNNEPIGMFVNFVLKASDDYKFVHVEEEGYVSSYSARTTSEEHHHQVWLEPASITAVYIPIVATRIGDVEVVVEAQSIVHKDTVSFTLTVEPDGAKQILHTSLVLDLRTQPHVLKFLNVNVTEVPTIPYSKWRYFIFNSPEAHVSLIGDVFGPVFHVDSSTYIGSETMLRKPEQAAEAVLYGLGTNLWMIHYLRLTNQLTKSILADALVRMNYYYAYMMLFQNDDGSFSMWVGMDKSVWVTAGVIRVFQQSRFTDWENDYAPDLNIIVQGMTWLLNQQNVLGSFAELFDIPLNPRMMPKSQPFAQYPKIHNIPLTAYVLITLCEVSNIPGDMRGKIASARNRAMKYLEKRVSAITDPYEMAIVTYALTLAGSVEGELAFLRLDRMKREQEGYIYWSTDQQPLTELYLDNQRPFIQAHRPAKRDAYSVEATAYALLVYIAKEGLQQENIVRFLNAMRMSDGGFISTQDSLIAQQALTEFSFRARLRDITNMEVTISASSQEGTDETLTIDENNLSSMQSISIDKVWGHLGVHAKGTGMALLQMEVSYSVDHQPLVIPPSERAFDLIMSATYSGRNNSVMNVMACQRWTMTSVSPTSGVVAFEMDIPTGYYQYQPAMDAFVSSMTIPNLRHLYVTQRKVYAFFRTLNNEFTCLNFTLDRWWPVANLSHYLKARIYDYYSPELYNETVFETYALYMLDICQVCGSYQCPYCFWYSSSPVNHQINSSLLAICIILTIGNLIDILAIFKTYFRNSPTLQT